MRQVITFKYSNVGGTYLADVREKDFVVLTGPSPWGTGTWGPFPASCILSRRDPTPVDSFPVSGCPSERWTIPHLDESIRRARYPW